MSDEFDILLIVLGFAVLILSATLRRRLREHKTSARHRRHSRNKRAAKRVFADVQQWRGDYLAPRILRYLRKIDPYVFEELVLTALEAQGHTVIRNRSYSGDGGVDGRFYMDGALMLVQAKRYRGAINAGHLLTFGKAIRQERALGGLFVHTGKTPPGAYHHLAHDPCISLVSGRDLVRLMRREPLDLSQQADR